MTTAARFTTDTPEHAAATARAAAHLPAPADIPRSPGKCWTAILSTAVGVDDPEAQPLFVRSRARTLPGTTDGTGVSFDIYEPFLPADLQTAAEVDGTGLHLSPVDAKHLIAAAESSIRHGADTDIARTLESSLKKPEGFTDPAAVAAVFPTNTALAAALRQHRKQISRRALNHTATVAGIPLTLPQILHVHDGLWQPEPAAADIERLLLEAGVEASVTSPSEFLTDLGAAEKEAGTILRKCGEGGLFHRNGTVEVQYLYMDLHSSTNGISYALWERIIAWGAGREAFESLTAEVKFTEQSYIFTMLGFDFDPEYYPSKKFVLASVLDSVRKAAADQAERDTVEALQQQVVLAADNSPDLPTLHDIMSLGMAQARAAGSSDWVGRRGLAAHPALLRLRFTLPEPAAAAA